MKKNILILCLIAMLISSATFSPFNLEEVDIVSAKDIFYKILVKKVKKINNVNIGRYEVTAVPFCSINTGLNEEKMILNDQLKIDSAYGYAIVKDKNKKLVSTVRKYPSQNISTSISFSKSELWDIKMIDLVIRKYSANPFFVSISPMDSSKVVGFFKNDSIHFLNRKLEIFEELESLIVQQFGSREKYFEIVKNDLLKKEMLEKVSSLEDMRHILKNDYIFRMNALPSDTVTVLNNLISEIQSSAQATIDQQLLLKQKILQGVGHLPTFCGAGVPFYGSEISTCIRQVLTEEQYKAFYEKREINAWLVSKVSNKMYAYLYNVKGVRQEQMKEALYNEIFRD